MCELARFFTVPPIVLDVFLLLLLMFFFLPSVISVQNIAMLFVNLLSVFYWSHLVAKTFLLVLSRRLVYRAIKFDCNYSEDILGTNIRVGSGREKENNSCSNIWNNWCFYFEDRHVLFSRVVFTMVCNFICTSFTHYHCICCCCWRRITSFKRNVKYFKVIVEAQTCPPTKSIHCETIPLHFILFF